MGNDAAGGFLSRGTFNTLTSRSSELTWEVIQDAIDNLSKSLEPIGQPISGRQSWYYPLPITTGEVRIVRGGDPIEMGTSKAWEDLLCQ